MYLCGCVLFDAEYILSLHGKRVDNSGCLWYAEGSYYQRCVMNDAILINRIPRLWGKEDTWLVEKNPVSANPIIG